MAGTPPGWDRRGVHMDRVGSANPPVATRHSRPGPPNGETSTSLIYFLFGSYCFFFTSENASSKRQVGYLTSDTQPPEHSRFSRSSPEKFVLYPTDAFVVGM